MMCVYIYTPFRSAWNASVFFVFFPVFLLKPAYQDSFLWGLWSCPPGPKSLPFKISSPGHLEVLLQCLCTARAEQQMWEVDFCIFCFFFVCAHAVTIRLGWASQQKWASNSWELAWDQSAYLIQVCVLVLGMSGSSWPGAGLFIPEPYILLWHSFFNLLPLSACTQQPRLVFRLSLPSLCSLGFPQKWLIFFCLKESRKKEDFNCVFTSTLWEGTVWSWAVLWAGFPLCHSAKGK